MGVLLHCSGQWYAGWCFLMYELTQHVAIGGVDLHTVEASVLNSRTGGVGEVLDNLRELGFGGLHVKAERATAAPEGL